MHYYLLERTELLTGTFVFISSPYRPNERELSTHRQPCLFSSFFFHDMEWGIELSGKGGGNAQRVRTTFCGKKLSGSKQLHDLLGVPFVVRRLRFFLCNE